MKKLAALLMVMFLAFSVNVYAANCEETGLDKAWDNITTMGKKGAAKEEALLKNKAKRAEKCAEKAAKQAKKDADKAASEMGKKLGL